MGRWPISRGLLLNVAPTVLRIYGREMLHRAKAIVPPKLAMILLLSAAASCHRDDRVDDRQASMNPANRDAACGSRFP